MTRKKGKSGEVLASSDLLVSQVPRCVSIRCKPETAVFLKKRTTEKNVGKLRRLKIGDNSGGSTSSSFQKDVVRNKGGD